MYAGFVPLILSTCVGALFDPLQTVYVTSEVKVMSSDVITAHSDAQKDLLIDCNVRMC